MTTEAEGRPVILWFRRDLRLADNPAPPHAAAGRVPVAEAEKFVAEIGWREFSAHLLHAFQRIADTAFRPEYDAMPWRDDPAGLKAWQHGRTGYPVVDADPASNVQNWQWVAGSGADASPYFRIFNPITQGRKFDADGRYVRRWVPELRRVPDRWLHAPWTAPPQIPRDAGVRLGADYPRPIVDHDVARKRALETLGTIVAGRVIEGD